MAESLLSKKRKANYYLEYSHIRSSESVTELEEIFFFCNMNELTFIPVFYKIFCQWQNFSLNKANNITSMIEKFMMVSVFCDDDIKKERSELGDLDRNNIKKTVCFIY